MKKLIVVALCLTSFSAFAVGGMGVLVRQSRQATYTVCFYSDGSYLTVGAVELCPLTY